MALSQAKKLPPQRVGNAGLYYVCFEMSRRGWNVMPTARNARGVDVVGYSNDGRRKLTIQVKALSKPASVPLGADLEKYFADWDIAT
jgi:hypothetical protein